MAFFQSTIVRNRLLSMLSADDFELLTPKLERVPLPLRLVLIEPNQPISYVFFPESGIVSTLADTDEGRIEVGITGREGVIGVPAILGVDRSPYLSLVQGTGEALRISSQDLRVAIVARPPIFQPLGFFIHMLMVQLGQTVYANVTFEIEVRLARWILLTQDRTDGAELQLTHEFLATMLGVRRAGVTSAIHALEGMGSIRNKRGRIEVVNREKLLELAGDAYQVTEDEYERVMARP